MPILVSGDLNQKMIAMLPRLRRFGLALTKNLQIADDLVQDTCERALSRPDQFRAGTRFDSWLFSIMHSIWKNQLRSAQRKRTEGGDALEIAADPLAHKVAEDRVALSELDQLILNLPLKQREVILMVSIEGHSYRETAEILDTPIGTVMSRLSRARLTLAEEWVR